MSVTLVNQWFTSWTVPDVFVNAGPANRNVEVNVSNVTSGHWLVAVVAWHAVTQLETTITVGDDAGNYWIPIATSPSSAISTAINPNYAFSSGGANWNIQNGAFTSVTSLSYGSHAKAIQITPNGTSAITSFNSNYNAVTPHAFYSSNFYVYSPTGYANITASVAMTNSGGTFIGTVMGNAVYVPPNTWTNITVSGQLLPTAANAAAAITMNNNPKSWDILYVGQGTVTKGSGFSAGTRLAVWAAPNVSPPTAVFAAPLGQVTALGAQVFEMAGLPTWLNTDAISTAFIDGSSTLNLSITPTQSDFIVATGALNNLAYNLNRLHQGWSASHFFFNTNTVDTVGDISSITSWRTSSTPTSAFFYGILPINSNPYFTTATTAWQASNSTISLTSSPVFAATSSTHSMKVVPNGTSTTVGALMGHTSAPSVTGYATYLGEAYVHAPTATGNISASVSLEWLTSAHATISTTTGAVSTVFSSSSVTSTAVWYNAVVQGVAPSTAAFASMHVNVPGHLAATKPFQIGRGSITKVTGSPVSLAGAVVSFKTTPTVPTQPNTNWPMVKLEAAFGQESSVPPDQLVWTDISNRLLSVSTDRGRQYELNALEAGEANFVLRNDDGLLTPGSSAAGAFKVEVYTPIRITALWNSKIYGVFRGFMERWPQTWTDPHWGNVNAIGVDAWAMFVTDLRTILQNEILLDQPFGYWTLGDATGSSTAVNLASGTGQFQLQQQLSTFGPSASASASASFGANSMPMPGDPGTAWQVKGLTSADATHGWTLKYTGPLLPPLTNNPTITWRAFPTYTGPAPTSGNRVALMTMVSTANFPILSVWMDAGTGIHVSTWNATTGAMTDHAPSSTFGYVINTIYFLTVSTTGFTLRISESDTLTGTDTLNPNWGYFNLNGRIDYGSVGGVQFGNVSFCQVAVFNRPIDYSRYITYDYSGVNGMQNDFGDWRVQRFLSYVGWATASKTYGDGPNMYMAGATDIAGQDVATAINNIAQTESATNWVDRNGYLTYRTRNHVLDRPVQAVFGENTAAGEIPYQVTVELDYDPQYVNNDIQITHLGTPPYDEHGSAASGSSSVQIVVTNQSSINQYSDRSLQLTSYFDFVNSSIDLGNWLVSQYSQPSMRVAQVEVEPANILGAVSGSFTTLLGLDIGDRITLNRRPIGANNVISLNVVIIGIHHDIEWKSGKWVIKFDLMPQQIAALESFTLTCDNTTLGKLDSGYVIGW